MPKNKGKEGNNRNRGKNEADDEKRELVFKEEGQEYYAKVLRLLRNDRCEAMCIDGTKRLCHVRGKMHKKVCTADDIILVGLRDYQDDKSGIIIKYMLDEARLLKACGELRVEMHK